MNPKTAELMNKRGRMSKEERDADILAETMGPVFSAMFNANVKPEDREPPCEVSLFDDVPDPVNPYEVG